MVSLYVKRKENGHVQVYAPTGAMVLKWRSSLTSELDGYPIASEPHLWWQACPWRKSLSRKIALTRIKFYGRKLQVKAFQTTFGQMQGCADFMRLWRNFMPRFSITIYCCPIKMSGSQFWVSSRKKRGKPADSPLEFVILYCKPKKYKLMGKGTTKKIHRREQYCRILLLSLPCQVELSFFCFDTIKLVKILHLTKLRGTYCSSETYKIY